MNGGPGRDRTDDLFHAISVFKFVRDEERLYQIVRGAMQTQRSAARQ